MLFSELFHYGDENGRELVKTSAAVGGGGGLNPVECPTT